MTDRELLEFAAKAAGISLEDEHYWINGCWTRWNPLTDDGDAFRLAVKLGLYDFDGLLFQYCNDQLIDTDTDLYAALRRAIVLAAAEIGRDMP